MIRRVRLELARCHEFPEGSKSHGYELRLPLTRGGKLDRDLWHEHREECGFRRFWGHGEEHGRLNHTHRGWALDFGRDETADEIIFHGDTHRFAEGEYVSITERDGITRAFRVTAVTPAA